MDSQDIQLRAESRLEQLAQSVDLSPAWRDMVGSMQQDASQLAVDSVAMAASGAENSIAAQALSERFESLAERLDGVGLQDIAENLTTGMQAAAKGDYDSLATASESALTASRELSATAELAKEYSREEGLPKPSAVELFTADNSGADASKANDYSERYGKFPDSTPLSGLLNLVDAYREGAGLDSLRDTSILFRTLGEIANDLGHAMRDRSTEEKLDGALNDVAAAQEKLGAAQESLSRDDSAGTRALVDAAHAELTRAEAAAVGALDALATELGAAAPQAGANLEGMSAGEATMQQFLEAGGVVTPEITSDVAQAESLAGLTVRELNSLDEATLAQNPEAAQDTAAMLDNLADRADALGLTDMAEGLRDAAGATLEGPGNVDLDAVKDFVNESAQTLAELHEASQAFSMGASELSHDQGMAEVNSMMSGVAEAGMVAEEVNLSSSEFSNLFENAVADASVSRDEGPQAEAESEMEMSR